MLSPGKILLELKVYSGIHEAHLLGLATNSGTHLTELQTNVD